MFSHEAKTDISQFCLEFIKQNKYSSVTNPQQFTKVKKRVFFKIKCSLSGKQEKKDTVIHYLSAVPFYGAVSLLKLSFKIQEKKLLLILQTLPQITSLHIVLYYCLSKSYKLLSKPHMEQVQNCILGPLHHLAFWASASSLSLCFFSGSL